MQTSNEDTLAKLKSMQKDRIVNYEDVEQTKPTYLSPSAISTYLTRPEQYVRNYILLKNGYKLDRMEQTAPMAIGSAFDAIVKSYLSEHLFGEVREGFGKRELFEEQVIPKHQEWAWSHGEYVFNKYKESGALALLISELEKADYEPEFEKTVQGNIGIGDDTVPLLGKPDICFRTKDDIFVIIDWKVNGYFSQRNTSPLKGYTRLWECFEPKTRKHNTTHKDVQMTPYGPFNIDSTYTLNHLKEDWARQLSIYAWLMGVPVGIDFMAGIDQITSNGVNMTIDDQDDTVKINTNMGMPPLKVSTYRNQVLGSYQETFLKLILGVWKCIQAGVYWRTVENEKGELMVGEDLIEYNKQMLVTLYKQL